MLSIHTANDFIHETNHLLNRAKVLVEMLVEELDFVLLSEKLIDLSTSGISLDIIIYGDEEKKNLRLIHLSNRLTQLGANIYWISRTKLDLSQNSLYSFSVIDKSTVICKTSFVTGHSAEEDVYAIHQLFQEARKQSSLIELLAGVISIKFSADQSFLSKAGVVKLSWETNNAQAIEIEGINEKLSPNGVFNVKVSSDTIFKLNAFNHGAKSSKQLLIKVLNDVDVKIWVEAFDEQLKEYIALQKGGETKHTYFAYQDQKIRVSWETDRMGQLKESRLGNLPLQGAHEFSLEKKQQFCFVFESIYSVIDFNFWIQPVKNEKKAPKEKKSNRIQFGLFRKREK